MKHRLQQLSQAIKKSAPDGVLWARRHKIRVAVLVLILAIAVPRPAKTQFLDPCCGIMAAGLSSISSALSNVIGGGLNSILSIEQDIANFQKNVVWPQQAISQAQALVGSVQGLSGQIKGVTNIAVNSATLAPTQQLEGALLSRDANQIGNAGSSYTAVYGAVPDATAAPPQVRNVIDISDAAAQDAMKRAIAIDNLADLELQAADQINQSIATAAPGSAPIIEAQADAWLVRANAYTQSAMAELMRVRAVDLANAGADVKSGANNASNLQRKIQQMLQPR